MNTLQSTIDRDKQLKVIYEKRGAKTHQEFVTAKLQLYEKELGEMKSAMEGEE